MKTIFENIVGSYTQQGDYLLPNLTLSDETENEIGVWGMRHKRYLNSNHRVLYYNFLTAGKLNNHLIDVDQRAQLLKSNDFGWCKKFFHIHFTHFIKDLFQLVR